MSGTGPALPRFAAAAGLVLVAFGGRGVFAIAIISPPSSCIVPMSAALHSRGVTAAAAFAL